MWNTAAARTASKQMDNDLKKPVVSITTTSTPKAFALWKTSITRAAKSAFGPKWPNCE